MTCAAVITRRRNQRACRWRVIVALACLGACVPKTLRAQDSARSANAAHASCAKPPPPVTLRVDTIYGSLQATGTHHLPTRYVELVLRGLIDHFVVPSPLGVPIYGGSIHGSHPHRRRVSGKKTGPDSVTLAITGAIAFTLRGDGRLTNARLVASSLSTSLDTHLLNAVTSLDSMHAVPPMPEGIGGDSVTLVFAPNTEPDSMSVSAPMFISMMPVWLIEHDVAAKEGNPQPRYPAQALERGIEDEILLTFAVDTSGVARMETVRVVRGTYREFAAAVLDVLPNWRFEPARIAGCAVMEYIQLPFAFRLNR